MLSKTIIATALISAVSAHQNWHQLWINNETPGYQVGIRMPPSNSPVVDVTSNDMACNVPSTNGGAVETVEANAGDSIKVKWDQSGHPGPITHFLLPVEDAATATGAGAGWFKIDEVDYVDGKWANEIMGANDMTHEFKLPTGLPSGQYLLRSEMLALHGAQTVGGAQWYMGCAQLKITGTGTGSCGPTISIPGEYKAEDANIYIPNVYNGFDATKFTAPGGPVATCGGAGSAPAPSVPSSTPKPANSTVPVASPVASSVASPISEASATPVAVETPVSTPISTPSVPSNGTAPISSPPASTTPSTGAGGALPEKFTLATFISWLEAKAAPKARRHARALY
ncbi:hypothetical protein CC86DRAFT_443802 [Ophiobolus disseminans]|uniref:AA9 family lytic polysaccharide monooxygenase n=1 Tax=Ophiobolus disseminans TaxID=1469910 RepID=A0A6A7AAG4_9PLEO|nr:hypothetical protein CC86DRAFT_443802 [Ophiobolus disseminans]